MVLIILIFLLQTMLNVLLQTMLNVLLQMMLIMPMQLMLIQLVLILLLKPNPPPHQEGIIPDWEDPRNAAGGRWIINVDR